MAPPPPSRRLSPAAFWALAGAIAIAALVVRWSDADHVVRADRIAIHDNDTARRLVRLAALDAADSYPVVERFDGYPAGSVIHWTLPMDLVIRVLDVPASWFLSQENGYEAGAIVAGPVLALLGILLMLLGARRLLGPGAAVVAAAVYALSYSIVNVSKLGNGDHQSLQHVGVLGSVLALLIATNERRPDRWPLLSGAALGLALWVSAETQTVFYLLALALFAQVCWPGQRAEDRATAARIARGWSAGLLAVGLLGHLLEHRSALLAFRWDVVSTFQLYQIAVFGLFAALASSSIPPARARGWIAAAAALAAGLLPIAVLGDLRGAIADQVRDAAEVNVWLQNEVVEFRALLSEGLGVLLARDGLLVFALPAFVYGIAIAARLRVPTRGTLVALTAGTFGLYLWEVKLGHLFAMAFPLAVVAGYVGLRDRYVPPAAHGMFDLPAAVIAIAAAWLSVPGARNEQLRYEDEFTYRVCQTLKKRAKGDTSGAVLAPWDMGAQIMYYAGLPVVASGYHRNIDGIRDALRVWLAQPDERDRARRILDERRVRFVLAWHSRTFLAEAPPTIGKKPMMTPRGEFTEAAVASLFWELRYADRVPGFHRFDEGREIGKPTGPESLYRLYERRE